MSGDHVVRCCNIDEEAFRAVRTTNLLFLENLTWYNGVGNLDSLDSLSTPVILNQIL